MVLLGRKRTRGPVAWASVPEVSVPLLTAAESTALAAGLFRGLLMPPEVQQRLVETVASCPFALEESLARMIQQRRLRRHYGNFFYSGGRDGDFEPSFRLIQHVEAEVSALGEAMPARLLALAETPVPGLELAAASLSAHTPLGGAVPGGGLLPSRAFGLGARRRSGLSGLRPRPHPHREPRGRAQPAAGPG